MRETLVFAGLCWNLPADDLPLRRNAEPAERPAMLEYARRELVKQRIEDGQPVETGAAEFGATPEEVESSVTPKANSGLLEI